MIRLLLKYYTHKNLIMLVMGMTIIGVLLFDDSRYQIAIDFEKVRCIPEYSVYFVDLHDKSLTRNKLYLFRSKDLLPIYPQNTLMIKYLRGMPGDSVKINQYDDIYINRRYITTGLALAKSKLGQPHNTYHGSTVIKDKQYWFMGTSDQSFDSRYWGTIDESDIVGRAYGIL